MRSTSPSTNPCSTAPLRVFTRPAPPTSPSWRWRAGAEQALAQHDRERPGSYNFGGRTFRSHEGGLGALDMHRAIQFSSNTYFYSLAVEMGVDAIHDFMKPLTFGQTTGIDLNGEVRGTLPSTEWKRNTYKRPEMKRWFPGETVSLGIGQGYNNFTMLQLAVAQATLANGGTRYSRPTSSRL